MQSTTHDGWGTRDSLPLRESYGNQTHVQAAMFVVVAVDVVGPCVQIVDHPWEHAACHMDEISDSRNRLKLDATARQGC